MDYKDRVYILAVNAILNFVSDSGMGEFIKSYIHTSAKQSAVDWFDNLSIPEERLLLKDVRSEIARIWDEIAELE